MTIGVVLLAAGRSQRFGSDKRYARLNNAGKEDTSVLFSTLQQVRNSTLPCFVVLRPGDQALAEQLDAMNIDWGICPDAHQGMGHSLAFGIKATQHWQGWLIALADMPWVQAETYLKIAETVNGTNIVRPWSEKARQHGHPVAFSKPYAYALMACTGDSGARHLLTSGKEITELTLADPGIVLDIDQPDDIHRVPT